MTKNSVSLSGGQTMAFMFCWASLSQEQILERDYMQVVFAISSLCVWNQMSWRNLQSIASRFFAKTPFLIWQSQKFLGYGPISLKTLLIPCKYFFDFRSDMIEKQGITNLSSYRSNSYALVLSDSDVTVLGEEEGAAFCQFISYTLFIDRVA